VVAVLVELAAKKPREEYPRQKQTARRDDFQQLQQN
jgi:hypothetical protein